MIMLKARRYDRKTNTPILYDREIDEFAHAVLQDYKPALLREPGKIRFEHFLESYLRVTLLYEDIFNEDPNRPIFGATAIRDGVLKIFNREETCVSKLPVSAHTVIIDNYVTQPEKEGLALFTGMHEGGHILIHGNIFDTTCDDQLELPGMESLSVICCRRSNIDGFTANRPNRTPFEWREHHADYFAAAVAMPNATFKPVALALLRENGITNGYIPSNQCAELSYLIEEVLPEQISKIYGVSKQAASIKLKKSGVIGDKKIYRRVYQQMTL